MAATPEQAEAEVRSLLAGGHLDLPLPGGGRTWQRFEGLARCGAQDPVLARLAEAHCDAVAILHELAAPAPRPGQLWGVWAAQPPGASLSARRTDGGWQLSGDKPFCSGAAGCDSALVTAIIDDLPATTSTPAPAPDRGRPSALFAVDLRAARAAGRCAPVPGSWPAVGMAASDSRTVRFQAAAAEPVGDPGRYTGRAGFWYGAAGVAACWAGGAAGVASRLLGAARGRAPDPLLLAQLGAVDAVLFGMRAALAEAAAVIDRAPSIEAAALAARRVRAVVETGTEEVLARTGHALGAGPLTLEPEHARRVADLTVYLRQSHAERDLVDLGERLLAAGPDRAGCGWPA